MEKKLIYVINHVQAADTTHLYHVLNLLGRMPSHGWVVDLVSERGGSGVQDIAGHQVTYLSRSGRFLRVASLIAHLVRQRARGYRLVFVRISKPAAVTAIVVGKLLGMKVCYWQSSANFDIDRRKPLLSRARDDALFYIIGRGADAFVTGPEAMIDYYNSQYGISRRKLKLLYNDIDVRRFFPAPRETAKSLCRVLFVHRFSPIRETAKYVPAIIESLNKAAAAGQRIDLCFIGNGPQERAVQEASRGAAAGVSVRFLGSVANRDLPAHYQAADIFIMPSYREGFPRVVVEAMASGLPVVTTDAGGTRDVVGRLQQQYVVSRDDPTAFGDRLYDLATQPELWPALASENLERVRRYSTESVAKMLDDLLLAVIGK